MISPFAMWTRMMDAARPLAHGSEGVGDLGRIRQHIIDARTALIQGAMIHPLTADYAERARMVPEKSEAFFSSSIEGVSKRWMV